MCDTVVKKMDYYTAFISTNVLKISFGIRREVTIAHGGKLLSSELQHEAQGCSSLLSKSYLYKEI